MVEKNGQVSRYYPATFPINGNIYYIATLNKNNPVQVFYNDYAVEHSCSTTINLFYIVDYYIAAIPEKEDWFVAYQAGFPFDEDIRNKNIRKYTKALVVEMLERLCSHKKLRHYCIDDIYVNDARGESQSFFRPYNTVHVDFIFSE